MSMIGEGIPAVQGGIYSVVRNSGVYMCLPCDSQFNYAPGHTTCPSCNAATREDLTALYIEEDAEQAEFVQMFDFGEGD